jgi:hypothetical protein
MSRAGLEGGWKNKARQHSVISIQPGSFHRKGREGREENLLFDPSSLCVLSRQMI